MKPIALCLALAFTALADAAPLRVFIRGGEKNHAPGAHEHQRFLEEWRPLLTGRGMVVDGAKTWPSAAQLAATDVLVMYAQDGGNATPDQKSALKEFTGRGGGLVVIHTAAVSDDPAWWKSVIGGAWVHGKTRWREGVFDLYQVENQRVGDSHPITRGASNFRLDDEIYYDMDLSPDIRVLATSFTPKVPAGKQASAGGEPHIYDVQPQMWAYEKDGYRAFVSLPGHLHATFGKPHFRALLLRGIAWAGKRDDVDAYCTPEEIAALTYPEGGPQRPADTLASLEVHPDFSLRLVASEPLIAKPMNFDWDPAGRLWVAETPEYPNGRRGMRPDYRGKEWKDHGGVDPTPGDQDRPAIDRIAILVDRDGDGVMDHKEIFHEGLELVTGLVFHRDGVIVTQAPDILWLRDTDRDGKCDKVEKLYIGLGTGDTHAVINNPRRGWDGWIYCTHGYSAGRVRSGDGKRDFGNIGSGVVRFRPDGSAFEQYSSKGGNTWGLDITADNRVLWTQPTSGQLLMETVLPERLLARGKVGSTASYHVVEKSGKTFPAMTWEDQAYRQIDWVGSFTAAAGCVIYDGATWPTEYRGDYFTTEPTINIVHHARLAPQGVSSTSRKLPGREETEFIRGKDLWWRPIEVRTGPDGAVYLADFYNQAVIHNDTRGPDHNRVNAAVRPDRDHYFGRIWKIDHKAAKAVPVPDLSRADLATTVAALAHPDRVVRMTAARLVAERLPGASDSDAARAELAKLLALPSPETRIAALWAQQGAGRPDPAALLRLAADPAPAVRVNVAKVVEAEAEAGRAAALPDTRLLSDAEPTVRLAALRALAAGASLDEAAKNIVAAWPKLDDDFQRSAAVAAASHHPSDVLALALGQADPAPFAPLVDALVPTVVDPAEAARLVVGLAALPASADPLKSSILRSLAANVRELPPMTPELKSALGRLLQGGTSGSVLPLLLKWDAGSGDFAGTFSAITEARRKELADPATSDAPRIAAAKVLLDLRGTGAEILPAVLDAVANSKSPAFHRAVIPALGATAEPAVGPGLAALFPKLPDEARGLAFEVLLQRADWSRALLDAARTGRADIATLGPANLARLRHHPDAAVARTANETLDELMGPALKAKSEALARLIPEVEKPGEAVKGRQLFTAACATCHQYDGHGSDIGPGLTGMGAHGPAELLAAIIDPNKEVDPSFVAWNIETLDGRFHSGVIARENPAGLVLRSLAGEIEIRTADIKSRVNTGRSLMPEGFEGLGGDALRDILAYLCDDGSRRFRMADLRDAFTADTRQGLYQSQAATMDTLPFRKFGTIEVGKIPFHIADPAKSPAGKNVVILKGGPPGSFAAGLPQRVEAKLGGFTANRLHFLGGVTGWGYQGQGDPSPVMKVTVIYGDGQREEQVYHNAIEFADYGPRVEVPGSRFADVVSARQVRFFSKALKRTAPIDRIVLESFASDAAPTTVAITAELADPDAPPLPAPAAPPTSSFRPQFSDPLPNPPASARGPRVLLVGGGSSHDFPRHFGKTDRETLAAHCGWVAFTQNLKGISPILDRIDVLVLSANQAVSAETREALLAFAAAGKGIVALHPGTWYAWGDFPHWNRHIVGGGTRGHDPLGAFTVAVVKAGHPVMRGVAPSFPITDELYHFTADSAAVPIEVLAEATSPATGKTYPQVFVAKHPKARIVGITLGHDARSHELPDFRTLLVNAVKWAAAAP